MLSYMVSCCKMWYVSDAVCMFICTFSLRCFFLSFPFACHSHLSLLIGLHHLMPPSLCLTFLASHILSLLACMLLPFMYCSVH
ncbi:hypothetical protein BDP27DRAFT_1334367, partial [Rhodocollybia butyracea]